MASKRDFVPVVIVGAGFSGLSMGCQLKAQLGFHDFVIYERSPELGGTWYANQYPGCGVDVPAVFYSLSFAPNPNFSKVFPDQPEILEYMKDVSKKYDVDRHIEYNWNWRSSKWQSNTKTWVSQFEHVQTKKVFEQESKILISGVGGLVEPQTFDLDGLETFKGQLVHSARWRKDINLKDKDVVVVGNGCSASQIIPAIAGDVSHVYQFIRTPQYFLPRINPSISNSWKFCFRYIPGFYTFFRWLIFLIIENSFKQFYLGESAKKYRDEAQALSWKFIDKKAPEEYRALLKPQYEVGCKRRIFDPGYIKSLHRSNVFLTDDRLVSATENAVVTRSGKHYPADVIIVANGFAPWRFRLPLTGINGASVEDHWESFGGPEAYKATAMADFPNFFMIFGPNSATGHTSALFSIENSVMFVIRMIKPLLRKKHQTIEIRSEAEKSWVQKLQSALKERVWADNCNTYYVDQKTGWNYAMYPFSSFHLWWMNRFPKMGDWKYD